jgi:hypothetical protein
MATTTTMKTTVTTMAAATTMTTTAVATTMGTMADAVGEANGRRGASGQEATGPR